MSSCARGYQGGVMGLYNFKKQFVPHILEGEKRQTIRADRARIDKVGDTMHLYTGLRQKGAQLLGRPTCIAVQEIEINSNGYVSIDGERLLLDEMERLARADGFDSYAHMMEFWEGRLPFRGHIFHWEAL
jgi:hypothetical protein